MNKAEDMARFAGTHEGHGSWHDAGGKSARYTIKQSTRASVDGFELAFTHEFDDGTVVDARLVMTWIAPHLFRVDIAGAAVGNGYVFDDCLHYHLKLGDQYVQASYRPSGPGLNVFGSSTTNADGLYIAWTEELHQTP
jgi:hypothetical protein